MRRIHHPEFFDVDLPRIEKELDNEERLAEFLYCFDKAILEIKVDPSDGAPLNRSLDRHWNLHTASGQVAIVGSRMMMFDDVGHEG
ncbi:MAG: hypothetical protein ACYCYO_09135 [Bacilli bacterium]